MASPKSAGLLSQRLATFGVTDNAKPSARGGSSTEDANALLGQLSGLLPILALDELAVLPGAWHPTGFMVFPLGHHSIFGALRWHIWPSGLRRRELKGRGPLGEIHDGDIHDHAWQVTSTVLAGTYQDTIYDVTPCDGVTWRDDPQRYRVYTVSYGAGQRNDLVTDGSGALATPTERRMVPAGGLHGIAAGVFHAPTVPDTAVCSTLVFSGHRELVNGPHVLIGADESIRGSRAAVTPAERSRACNQLRAIWC